MWRHSVLDEASQDVVPCLRYRPDSNSTSAKTIVPASHPLELDSRRCSFVGHRHCQYVGQEYDRTSTAVRNGHRVRLSQHASWASLFVHVYSMGFEPDHGSFQAHRMSLG